jgi:hypothetical protein
MKHQGVAAWLAAVGLCLWAVLPSASAAIYRCAGPDGKTYFSDTECPLGRGERHVRAPEVDRPQVTPPAAAAPVPAAAPPPAPAVAAPAADSTPPPAATPDSNSRPEHALPAGRGGNTTLLLLAALLMVVGEIWLLVIAFTESILWGVLVLVIPGVSLIFLIVKFPKGMKPVLLMLLSLVMAFTGIGKPGPVAGVTQSYMVACTTEGEPIADPAQVFSNNDFVCLRSELVWERALKEPQLVSWRWYKGDRLAEVKPRSISFTTPPMTVTGVEPAFALGPGHHKVELYLNGVLVNTQSFEVR